MNGTCRHCTKPRPPGCTVTCGGSECQQTEHQANATRTKRPRKPKQQTMCSCGHPLTQHVNGQPTQGCLAGMTDLTRRNGLCRCERFNKETP